MILYEILSTRPCQRCHFRHRQRFRCRILEVSTIGGGGVVSCATYCRQVTTTIVRCVSFLQVYIRSTRVSNAAGEVVFGHDRTKPKPSCGGCRIYPPTCRVSTSPTLRTAPAATRTPEHIITHGKTAVAPIFVTQGDEKTRRLIIAPRVHTCRQGNAALPL